MAVVKRLRGTSSQVYTRCTPGTASAADLSMDTMRACAWGECSTLRCNTPSISVSIVNSARPVTTSALFVVRRPRRPARPPVGRGGSPDAGADGLAGQRLLDRGDPADGILD